MSRGKAEACRFEVGRRAAVAATAHDGSTPSALRPWPLRPAATTRPAMAGGRVRVGAGRTRAERVVRQSPAREGPVLRARPRREPAPKVAHRVRAEERASVSQALLRVGARSKAEPQARASAGSPPAQAANTPMQDRVNQVGPVNQADQLDQLDQADQLNQVDQLVWAAVVRVVAVAMGARLRMLGWRARLARVAGVVLRAARPVRCLPVPVPLCAWPISASQPHVPGHWGSRRSQGD